MDVKQAQPDVWMVGGQTVEKPTDAAAAAMEPLLDVTEALKNGVTAAPYGVWSTGLFDCRADGYGPCFLTAFFPCIQFGRNAEMLDSTHPALAGSALCGLSVLGDMIGAGIGIPRVPLAALYACHYRQKLRAKYGLPGSATNDFCAYYLCGPCAVCQDARELKLRGAHVELAIAKLQQQKNAELVVPPKQDMVYK
eukprot:jgi/Chlat1/8840/Chrsp91S08177